MSSNQVHQPIINSPRVLPLTNQQWAKVVSRLQTARADQRGSQISDNLGLIVIGVLAIVAIGAAITGLGTEVITWVTSKLGVG